MIRLAQPVTNLILTGPFEVPQVLVQLIIGVVGPAFPA
jgi:hypothetical protein